MSSENINKFLKLFSKDVRGFRDEMKKYEIKNNILKTYEFNPLKRFPVVKTNSARDDEKYIIPSLPDFLYSFSEGLYYVLLDKLDDDKRKTLFEQIGNVFEGYVGSLIKYYKVDSLSNCNLHCEVTYKTGKNEVKSADWLLMSDEYIFQIECKKRKLDNYSRAGIEFDGRGIKSTVKDIAKELNKLMAKESHIKNNILPSMIYKNQKIINIIVYLDEMYSINRYARTAIIDEMRNKSDNFYILGCYQFELLCQMCRNNNASIFQSLQCLLNNHTTEDVDKIDYLDDVFDNFFKSLKENKA